ncbi:MAG: nucleoside phosphorylase [Saprospiraceae bacterium]|nr:nucleoside phosphorylase [Saprospiraceae bacterium]
MLQSNKSYTQESVFKPENLLREARRQKRISECEIPEICVLDPDGDILAHLIESQATKPNQCWACYHTNMYQFDIEGTPVGIVGNAVGAPFAVLLAEQMFVSGCKLIISITSAGLISPVDGEPEYILITRALRDEGTSHHYIPTSEYSYLSKELLNYSARIISSSNPKISLGTSWTTDAPYRETPAAIQDAKSRNIHVVEMEAAALYAFAQCKNKSIVCFAHITNSMAQNEGDFEKGEKNGSVASLELIRHTIQILGAAR